MLAHPRSNLSFLRDNGLQCRPVDQDVLERIRRLYAGDLGRYRDRIERGRPATWIEENIVRGRRKLRELLAGAMAPLEGLRILDAGCGAGELARFLAARGARVTGVDLTGRFGKAGAAEEPGGPTWIEGDFLALLPSEAETAEFDELILSEVLEDYPSGERYRMIRRLGASRVPRIWLVFRDTPPGAGRLWSLAPGPDKQTLDPVELLRCVHTTTPYRQIRAVPVHCRNFRVQVSELVLDSGSFPGSPGGT